MKNFKIFVCGILVIMFFLVLIMSGLKSPPSNQGVVYQYKSVCIDGIAYWEQPFSQADASVLAPRIDPVDRLPKRCKK